MLVVNGIGLGIQTAATFHCLGTSSWEYWPWK
jgi:hypothetical protein